MLTPPYSAKYVTLSAGMLQAGLKAHGQISLGCTGKDYVVSWSQLELSAGSMCPAGGMLPSWC
jgi:hypothetical protein